MMDMICDDLVLLGVKMDVFSSEKVFYGMGKIESVIEWFEVQGLIYNGVLELFKGKKFEDWELCE